MRSLRLLGRAQVVEHSGITYVIDSSATPAGIAATVAEHRPFDAVICGIPDDRDHLGIARVLVGRPGVHRCSIDGGQYSTERTALDLLDDVLARLRPGDRVLITGVVAFAAQALSLLPPDAPLEWS